MYVWVTCGKLLRILHIHLKLIFCFYFFINLYTEIHLTIGLKLATVGAWVAGTAFILKRYINDPKTLMQLFNTVILPSGVLVKCICEGSILCILDASDLHGLHTLWQNYESGLLKKSLEDLLLTEDLCTLAEGSEIIMDVVLDKRMYRDVCLELMINKVKGG